MLEEMKVFLENKNYSAIRVLLEDELVADIAEWMEELNKEQRIVVFRLLPKNKAADVFSYLPLEIQQTLILSLSEAEMGAIIDDLYSDDAVELIEEMPANVVKMILKNANNETRATINQLLKYPEDSAGGHMSVDFVDLKPNMTVRDSIRRIRQIGIDKESINVCYVVDDKRHLLGIVSSRQLLLHPSDTIISDIMTENVLSINTLLDQEQVAHEFSKYDYTIIPVVDNESRLVGIITIDDVVDIIEEEATEDMEIMAAMAPSEKPYLKTPIFEIYKNRVPWLLILMISATFTGRIIASFEESLAACAVLTVYIPMLMNSGGNSGSQASVSVIRGLSLGEIELKDIIKIIWKESRLSMMLALTLAVANFFKIILLDHIAANVALVVCAALFCTTVVAQIVGGSLPVLAKKLGFDPAIMASPFITTIVDALSLLIYFMIAKAILHI